MSTDLHNVNRAKNAAPNSGTIDTMAKAPVNGAPLSEVTPDAPTTPPVNAPTNAPEVTNPTPATSPEVSTPAPAPIDPAIHDAAMARGASAVQELLARLAAAEKALADATAEKSKSLNATPAHVGVPFEISEAFKAMPEGQAQIVTVKDGGLKVVNVTLQIGGLYFLSVKDKTSKFIYERAGAAMKAINPGHKKSPNVWLMFKARTETHKGDYLGNFDQVYDKIACATQVANETARIMSEHLLADQAYCLNETVGKKAAAETPASGPSSLDDLF